MALACPLRTTHACMLLMESVRQVSSVFLRSRQIAAALRTAPEFSWLSDAQIAMLAHGGEERCVPRYTVLYREGSASHSFYVLLAGTLQHATFHSSQRHTMSAADGERGVCLGTEGLSGNLRRLTTVSTLTECALLRFSTSGMRIDHEGTAGLASRAFEQVAATAPSPCGPLLVTPPSCPPPVVILLVASTRFLALLPKAAPDHHS